MAGAHLEVEVKLPVADREGMPGRLEQAGAILSEPCAFEDNRVLDFPDGRLRQCQIMLRMRLVDGAGLVTVKEKVAGESVYKVRQEHESRVENGASLLATLQAAGFITLYRYQKYRSTYRAGDLLITLDDLPLGCYLELEGEPEAIDQWAEKLGYSRSDYIRDSYRTLHLQQHATQGGRGEPCALLFPAGENR